MAVIIWHKELDSTNNEARRQIGSLDNMSVISAERQTAGRGQGDHSWSSETGLNLTFTVVLKPENLTARDSLYLTECITRAIREYLLCHGVAASIKWPNDIYVDGLKICGILIENIVSGNNVVANMTGIGLNLNQTEFPEDLPNPVSLKQLTGVQYDIKRELELLCKYIEESASLLSTQDGRTVLSDYFAHWAFNIPEGQQL